MAHSGSGSSLSTPASQIVPCTMGSEPDLTLYFYGTAKHKPPPTASYISQRWEYDCDPARLGSSSIFRKAFSTSQAKFTYAYAWLKQSKRCKAKPSSQEGTSSAVTRLQPWAVESGVEGRPLAAPAECLHTSLLLCPTACLCHMLCRKSVFWRYSKDTRHLLLELLQRPKLSWIHQCRSLR